MLNFPFTIMDIQSNVYQQIALFKTSIIYSDASSKVSYVTAAHALIIRYIMCFGAVAIKNTLLFTQSCLSA